MNDSQPLTQAPLKEHSIPQGHENAGATEGRRSSDKGHELSVRLPDGVSKVSEIGGIARDAAVVFDDSRCALSNRVDDLPTSVMAMHPAAYSVAGIEIAFSSLSYMVPSQGQSQRLSLHAGDASRT